MRLNSCADSVFIGDIFSPKEFYSKCWTLSRYWILPIWKEELNTRVDAVPMSRTSIWAQNNNLCIEDWEIKGHCEPTSKKTVDCQNKSNLQNQIDPKLLGFLFVSLLQRRCLEIHLKVNFASLTLVRFINSSPFNPIIVEIDLYNAQDAKMIG